MKHRLFTTLILFTITFYHSIAQYTLTASDVEFADGVITDYINKTEKDIIIPDQFNGITVTSIGEEAFQNDGITSVEFPNTLISIGNLAFRLNKIKNLTFPNSLTSIGELAFTSNQIESLSLPNSILTIGSSAFSSNDLTEITIPNSLTVIENSIFRSNKLTKVNIPNTITSIGNNVFKYNQLTSIDLPGSITSIGNYAFEYNKLTEIIIPEAVEVIESGTFQNNALTSVTIPTGVTSIFQDAFKNNLLEEITIPNTVDYIGHRAFKDNLLKTLSIPSSVTNIRENAFENNLLEELVIPNSVTSLGSESFKGNKLSSVTISNNLSVIHYSTFENNELTNVTIPSSVTAIASSVFKDNQLSEIIIPNTVTRIFDNVFSGNTLTSFNLPSSGTGYNWEDGNGSMYSNGATVNDLTIGYTRKELEDFRITYHLNGGSTTDNPSSYNLETPTFSLNSIVKDYYQFESWYSDALFNNQLTEIAKGTTGNLDLYAKFLPIEYLITYHLDGGLTTNPTAYTIEAPIVELTDGTKEGFTFDGWYLEPTFETKIVEIESDNVQEIVLYAKFMENIVTASLNKSEVDFSIYPNPADAELNIALGSSGNTNLAVYTITGSRVLSREIEGPVYRLNTSDWESGIYIVRIENQSYKVEVR